MKDITPINNIRKKLSYIQEIREQKGLTEEFIAQKLQIPTKIYHLIETGKQSAEPSIIRQIAQILNFNYQDIIMAKNDVCELLRRDTVHSYLQLEKMTGWPYQDLKQLYTEQKLYK